MKDTGFCHLIFLVFVIFVKSCDLIGNKIADKITPLGKRKSKEKEDERQEIYILPEKRQQIIDDLRSFSHNIKLEYQKNYKFARHNI